MIASPAGHVDLAGKPVLSEHPHTSSPTNHNQIPYTFTKIQMEVVTILLKKNPGWRLALPSDNNDSVGLRSYQEVVPGYQPYFVEGRVGTVEGFGIVLVDASRNFGIVWFTQDPEGHHYLAPQWLTRKGALESGGLFLDQRGLSVGGCFACDNLVLFVWDKRLKKLRQWEDN